MAISDDTSCFIYTISFAVPKLFYVNASSLQEQLAAIARAENEGKTEEKRIEDARKEQERQRANAERIRKEKAAAMAAAKENNDERLSLSVRLSSKQK